METSPSDPAVKPVFWTRALLVLAVYAGSLAAPVPFPGAMAFYMGFKSVMIPITGWDPPNHSRGDEIAAVALGLAWLANPLILAGMIALARGSRGWALMLGTSAICFALAASWLAVMTVMFLGSYGLWISSMGFLVYQASRPVTLPEVNPVAPLLPSFPRQPCRCAEAAEHARECRKWAKAAIVSYIPALLISVWAAFLWYPVVPVFLYAAHLLLWGALILLARLEPARERCRGGGGGNLPTVSSIALFNAFIRSLPASACSVLRH